MNELETKRVHTFGENGSEGTWIDSGQKELVNVGEVDIQDVF